MVCQKEDQKKSRCEMILTRSLLQIRYNENLSYQVRGWSFGRYIRKVDHGLVPTTPRCDMSPR